MVDESAVAAPPETAGRSATLDQHKSDGDVARRHRRVIPPVSLEYLELAQDRSVLVQ